MSSSLEHFFRRVPRADSADAMPSRLGAMYSVDAGRPDLDAHRKALRMQPKECVGFGKRPADGDDGAFDVCVSDAGGRFHVPRFYGWTHFGPPAEDARCAGLALGEEVRFASSLSGDQARAFDATLALLRKPEGGAILQRKAGGGKTVIALALVHALGRRAIVFSHKTDLLDQWRDRIREHLPGATVGRLQQNRVDMDADVVLATLQSVALRDYADKDPAFFDAFGLAVFDEAHHMGGKHFFGVTRKVAPRHILGLTATPERRDGLTSLLLHGLGPIVALDHTNVERPEHVSVTRVTYTGGSQREVKYGGRLSMPTMLQDIARDARRTRLVAGHVHRLHAAGRHTIVLSAFIDHLQAICREVLALGVPEGDVGFYIGSTRAAQRELVRKRPVCLATYSMAKEGLDIKRLDAEVLATPVGDVEQAVGRIQRPCADKQSPAVLVDIVDPYSVFVFTARKRRRFYEGQGFDVADERA